jgi:hypothetical protein
MRVLIQGLEFMVCVPQPLTTNSKIDIPNLKLQHPKL